MRYKLDSLGYIFAVAFGCYLEDCKEYTGAIPSGYNSLDSWATYACIQAYYLDQKGNLTLDYYRKAELESQQEQEAIANTPVVKKDLDDTLSALDTQYVKDTKKGNVIVLDKFKTVTPKVKITGVNPYEYDVLSIFTQGKNMMPCDAVSCVIDGVTFTKNMSGSITVLGTATKDIEYTLADGNATTIFALKGKTNYYLNLGGLKCEMRYFDGETTSQQYIGPSGLLNLSHNIAVTQVLIRIAKGETVNVTFHPQLERGKKFTSYDSYKCKSLDLDISSISHEPLLPSDSLYAEDTLYPGYLVNTVDYINIADGKVVVSVNDKERVLCNGSVGLFGGYSTIYSPQNVNLEIEYSTTDIAVDSLKFLQGKETTTGDFSILENGTIYARNGYFSGTIYATDGVFFGDITGGSININNRFKVNSYGDVTLPDDAFISWGQLINPDEIVTTITKNTVTTAYVNALEITAGSVRAENITGTTISGKTFKGGEVRSTNYKASDSGYTCGAGMRIDLTNGDIWWENGSIRASYQKAYFTALEATYLNIDWKTALSTDGDALKLGGGFSTVKLSSGATVTSLAEKKENITPCVNALSAIQNSDIYYFNYKNDGVKRDDIQKVGFIIGEGYNLDSRLLSKEGDAIDICNAIGLNWRATQQLYEKIKKQQEKIDEILSLLKQS